MTDKKKKKLDEVLDEGLNVGFNFGGLFKGLESIIQGVSNLQDMADKAPGTTTQEFSIPGLGKEGKGIFGFSVKPLKTGAVKVEPFGNVKRTPKGPKVDEVREPIVDVFEEDDHIQLLVEMPGVEEEDVAFEIQGDIVTISASGKRAFSKEILLSAQVSAEPLEASLKNGVFVLKLRRSSPK